MSRLRFILLFFLFLSTIYHLSSTIYPVLGQSNNFLLDKQSAIKEGSNQEAWLNEALGSNLVSGIQMLSGSLPESIIKGEPPKDGKITYTPSGALGTTNQLISSLYSPPASGIEYLAQLKDNFLGKPVYAQGVGFHGLQPILPIWRTFRNIIYILSSLVFIVIGIMIILRIKISPQTVISIQNAIPQLIITLILVTFSYAIAGLLIDLSYLVQSVFITALFNATGKDITGDLFDSGIISKVIDFFKNLFTSTNYTPNDFASLSNPGLFKFWGLMKVAVPTWALMKLSAIIGAVTGAILGSVGGAIIGGLAGGALIFFIIQILVLISLLRFFFGLIKAYITIIIKIILAPLEIGMGAFPNSKTGFSTWVWDLVANISVFPASLVFILLIDVIVQSVDTSGIWTPTLLGTVGIFNIIPIVVGLGGILLLPKLPELIPQVIFQIKPSPFGSAIGQSLAPVGALGWTGAQYLSDKQQGRLEFLKSQTPAGQAFTPGRRDRILNTLGDLAGNLSGGKLRRKPSA